MSNIIAGLISSTDPFDASRNSVQMLIGVLYFCYFLVGAGWRADACIFIGVICAAFDTNKQGWHDKIAGGRELIPLVSV